VQFSYNPFLVLLSIAVAMQASYVGLSLALNISSAFALRRRLLIAGAAITLAVGIWSMHFVGMLALITDGAINYAVLPTLLSFLLCVLVMGIAIFLASLRSQGLLILAALVMGLGITTMHFVGMLAVHDSAMMTHDLRYAFSSLLIAIAASGLALWLAFSADHRPPLLLCAAVLGCAVSGMHYMAMAGTTLHFIAADHAGADSIISGSVLAVIVSVVAFSISGLFLLTLIPVEPSQPQEDPKWKTVAKPEFENPDTRRDEADADESSKLTTVDALNGTLLPIEKNGHKFHISPSEIISVHANAHYTYIFNGRDDLFCPLSITEIAARLSDATFFRTHRSYIVNLANVVRVKKSGDAGVAELDAPIRRTVPVSRARVSVLRQELGAYQRNNKPLKTG
jgi:diguanylate cyclase